MATPPDVNDLADFQAKDPQQALDAALGQVQSFCHWHIAPSRSDSVTIWSDGQTLILPTMYLTAVTSVTQDGAVVPASSYTFESDGVIRANLGACFYRGTKITVVFTHGYTTMPSDAASVVLGLAQRSLTDTRGLVTRPGAPGITGASFVETYGPVLTDADKEKLAPYTITGFA